MEKGTVKFFNTVKGFGFITPESGAKDVFVHSSGLLGTIREGDKVTYDVESSPKGPSAVNVKAE
jgi:CspA family cold shock protein